MKIEEIADGTPLSTNVELKSGLFVSVAGLNFESYIKKILLGWGVQELVPSNVNLDVVKNSESSASISRFSDKIERHIEIIKAFYSNYSEDSTSMGDISVLFDLQKEVREMIVDSGMGFMPYLSLYVINKNTIESYLYMEACYVTYFSEKAIKQDMNSWFVMGLLYNACFYNGLKVGLYKNNSGLEENIYENSLKQYLTSVLSKTDFKTHSRQFFDELAMYYLEKKSISSSSQLAVDVVNVISMYVKRIFGYGDMNRYSETKVLKEIGNIKKINGKIYKLFCKTIGNTPIGSIVQMGGNDIALIMNISPISDTPDYYLFRGEEILFIDDTKRKEDPFTFSVSKSIRDKVISSANNEQI